MSSDGAMAERTIQTLISQIDDMRSSVSKDKKKVLVSGCFDLLHSGHVEFFREAAEYGDLYVRIGTDANIRALKAHETMYSDSERLFMVQNIKWVHNAALSAGSGRFDFKTDMALIKPDIYICNDDASGMDKRIEICEEMGIELVVPVRKAASGLEARSSTSMKARLRDMVRRDDAENQNKAVADFNEVIPWRFCFAGGWMDLKWCNELYPGAALTINIKFNPSICKDFCGLATSSRKCWIKLWNGTIPNQLEAAVAAKYLYGAENFGHFGKYIGEMPEWEKSSYSAGSQDHCGLMFPGVNKLCFKGAHWPSSMVSLHDRTVHYSLYSHHPLLTILTPHTIHYSLGEPA
jgi:cytidyltransferase-like protein